MDTVLGWLVHYEYFAMFGILMMCGIGLPLPEEVTLIASGLLVGWGDADFSGACLACISGILCGDSLIFGLGHHYGQRFLDSKPMHLLLSQHRQQKVKKFFDEHGSKALFLARFFPGVRIGVYAFAGSQGVSWRRFFSLDLLGVIISGPASIWIGAWAARRFAESREDAMRIAAERVREFGLTIAGLALIGVLLVILLQRIRRRTAVQDPSSVIDKRVS
jgi:membrane protein DedA with SNARE-associated domain